MQSAYPHKGSVTLPVLEENVTYLDSACHKAQALGICVNPVGP